jgi:hypothetical protein
MKACCAIPRSTGITSAFKMATAVILNLSQAKIFTKHGVAVEDVVSFCPSATHYLREKHCRVISTSDIYGAISHAKVVVLVSRELEIITMAAEKQYTLNYPEAEGLRVYLYHYLCCIYHLHFCLRYICRTRQQFYWVQGKELKYGDSKSMFEAVAMQPSAAILSYAYADYSIANYLVANVYNRITAFFIAHSKRLKVIDYGDELPKRIIYAMIANGESPLVIHTHNVGKNLYRTTRFFIKSLSRIAFHSDTKPVYVFRTNRAAQKNECAEAFAIPALYDADVQSVVKMMVEKFIPFLRTEVVMGRWFVEKLKPHIAVSDHAKYAYILSGLEVLKEQGGKHAMLNHGTHTVQYDAISKRAATLWASQQRAINRNTTHSLPKSPLTAQLVEEIRPVGDYELCKINVYGKIENNASHEGKFVVLQAGNYTDAMNHIPWCKETADEYLLAIVELLEEVAKLDNVELIIKLKNKKSDTHKAIVEGHILRLNMAGKACVDTTSKFSDLMARAHIVVCNLSGTIEEALANNIPLMIHTYRKSYFHIAEQSVKASAIGNLAPAYLVKERADIGRIIMMLDKERANLNNPALYKTVAWQADELMSMQGFAEKLVRDARP